LSLFTNKQVGTLSLTSLDIMKIIYQHLPLLALKKMQNEFITWQLEECKRLGITKEQHNQILELAEKLDTTFGSSDAYKTITSWIAENPSLNWQSRYKLD